MDELKLKRIYKKADFIGVLITTTLLYGFFYLLEIVFFGVLDSEFEDVVTRNEIYFRWLDVILIPPITYLPAYFLVWHTKRTPFLRWNWLLISLLGTFFLILAEIISSLVRRGSFSGPGNEWLLRFLLYEWLIFSSPIVLTFLTAFAYERFAMRKSQ